MAPKAHKYLWPYAMRHAVYISNMLPTMALGSHAYNTLYRPMGNRSQWQSCQSMGMRYMHYSTARHERSSVPEQEKQGIYIGQAESMLGCLFYDPKTQTIALTGHAFFNKDLSRKQTWTEELLKTKPNSGKRSLKITSSLLNKTICSWSSKKQLSECDFTHASP